MKTSWPLLICLLLSSSTLLFNATSSLGQGNAYYPKAVNNSKGYWQLKTDYAIRGTLIQFFTADSQLVYQESLPNRFIDLTPRNIRRLDRTLARLVDNRLVASSIPTSELIANEQRRPLRKPNLEIATRHSEHRTRPVEPAFQVQLFTVSGTPSVHLLIANPTLDRLNLTILSTDNAKVYEHITHLAASRHHLDLADMPPGTYQVRVKSSNQQYQQLITLTYRRHEAIVQIEGNETLHGPKQLISRK